jgi:hypothetical protein
VELHRAERWTGEPSVPNAFGSHIIEVAEADTPELGTAVTLTFALQA